MTNHHRESNFWADPQSDLLNDYDQTLFMMLLQLNSQHPQLNDVSLSTPLADVDPLETVPSHGLDLNGNSGIEEDSAEALGGLETYGDDGLSHSETSESMFVRTNNTDTDSESARRGPATINTMLNARSTDSSKDRFYTPRTPFQILNGTESSSSWHQSRYWSQSNSANLHAPIYTPPNSSAATGTQSPWETLPPTPYGGDDDVQPMPDKNSAFIQSYNNLQTGIWSYENTYGRDTTALPTMGMRHDNGIDATVIGSLPQSVQEIFANADAATPFGAPSRSKAESAAPSVSSSSTVRGPGPQNFESPTDRLFRISTVNIGAMSPSGFPEVELSLLPRSYDQKTLRNIAPRTVAGNSPLPATNMPSPTFTDSPIPVPSPAASAGIPTTRKLRCRYSGCQSTYTSEDSRRRHERLVHGNEPKPECPECHKIFNSGRQDNVKKHFKHHHQGLPLPPSLKGRTKKLGPKIVTSKGHVKTNVSRRRS